MSSTCHAFDILDKTTDRLDAPVFVLFGDQRFLQLSVLESIETTLSGDEDEEFVATRLQGDAVSWSDVQDLVASFEQEPTP